VRRLLDEPRPTTAPRCARSRSAARARDARPARGSSSSAPAASRRVHGDSEAPSRFARESGGNPFSSRSSRATSRRPRPEAHGPGDARAVIRAGRRPAHARRAAAPRGDRGRGRPLGSRSRFRAAEARPAAASARPSAPPLRAALVACAAPRARPRFELFHNRVREAVVARSSPRASRAAPPALARDRASPARLRGPRPPLPGGPASLRSRPARGGRGGPSGRRARVRPRRTLYRLARELTPTDEAQRSALGAKLGEAPRTRAPARTRRPPTSRPRGRGRPAEKLELRRRAASSSSAAATSSKGSP